MESAELVVVKRFPSLADAHLAKAVLGETQVESMVRSDDVGGMYPAIGGAELLVRAKDVDRALEALGGRKK